MSVQGDEAVFKKVKGLFLAVILLMFTITAIGCSEEVVASVNGEKITRDKLTRQVNDLKAEYEKQGVDFSGDMGKTMIESLEKETLDQMIEMKLMLQEARKIGTLTPEQIQEKVKPIKEQLPSTEEYQRFLQQVNLNEEEVAYVLNFQDEMTKDVAPASEEEARNYYDENPDQFSKPEKLQVRHVLFFVDDGSKGYPFQHTDEEAKKLAEDVIAQIEEGKDFTEIAREKSEDSGTKAEGGLYTFSKGEAVKEFSDAAYDLGPGEYTRQPVKTDYGYHVIKMEKVIPATQESFEQVKELLQEMLTNQAKQVKFQGVMLDIKGKATVVNKLVEKD